jgi:hypothetical protein
MNPARQKEKPMRSARLKPRVVVVGLNSAELAGICSILGLPD